MYQGEKYGADAADIHISPDGKFLYGSLRASINELVLFEISDDGSLTYRNRFSTLGKTPRNFAIDPTGNFLLVGNGGSDEIIIFKRDKENGSLTATGKRINVDSPVCLKFAGME
jgi:6-phosphogluconolactonase